jgi:thioredoxin reductase
MKDNKQFDVIIVGGSYSGLAAAMSLGRALKKVLVIVAVALKSICRSAKRILSLNSTTP